MHEYFIHTMEDVRPVKCINNIYVFKAYNKVKIKGSCK